MNRRLKLHFDNHNHFTREQKSFFTLLFFLLSCYIFYNWSRRAANAFVVVVSFVCELMMAV